MDTMMERLPTPAHEAIAPISRQIWEDKYRFKTADGAPIDLTIADTWRRIARALAAVEPRPEGWEERFYAALEDFKFLPAGRIVSGAGTDRRVTLFNCFVMGDVPDDLGGIFAHLREAALTMQQGGGIGYDFSTLRPKGASVKGVSADASGPLSFMDVWDAMCRTIMSAGARRGAMMATMRCDHPDIEAFVAAKREPGRLRNFNLSVLITDPFMAAVEADAEWPLVFGGVTYRTVQARALWDGIMRATYDYAEPGVLFIDRINARNNLAYCETIHSTNPCVTADTWVETADGPAQVRDLVGRPFTAVVHGAPWPSDPRGFFATGSKPVYRLTTREGFSIRLTADHLVMMASSKSRSSIESRWCPAGDLQPGDLVVLNDHRTRANWQGQHGHGQEVGYLVGLLVGDGTLKADKAVLSVWRPAAAVGEDAPPSGVDGMMARAAAVAMALPHRSDFTGWMDVGRNGEQRLALGALKGIAAELGLAPQAKRVTAEIEVGSSDFYRGFLSGMFDCDGSVQGSHAKGVSVRLTQSSFSDLQAVQRMLLRLGIRSTIHHERHAAGMRAMPDGRSAHGAAAGTALYDCREVHELVISGENMARFADQVGFSDHDKAARLAALLRGYRRELNRERFTAEVASFEPDGEEEVFDATVPGIHAFDAAGLLVHNCAEQPLPPYGACLLGSINLARFVRDPFTPAAHLDEDALADVVGVAVRMLDNTIDASGFPLEEQRREAMAKRRVGLGLTGLADALMMVGLRYGSEPAAVAAERWAKLVNRMAYVASAELAAEKGAFPLYDREPYLAGETVRELDADVRALIGEHGIRNALLTSIAPTGTISLLADNVSSGIEPVFAHAYTRKVLQPDGTRREEAVEDYAVRLYCAKFGADAELPEHFVTAQTLTPTEHVRMQAALQRHVDSAISKTVNVPEDIPFEAFQQVYLDAYRSGCKGCTTYRPNAITGSVLATTPAPAVAPAAVAPPLPTHEKTKRPGKLAGSTYKLRWVDSEHALYITINDLEENGQRRPFEVFISSANMEHFSWVVALTRMISAVFRRGGDVGFVAEELKGIFDPRGGQWSEGRYVPSLIAAIGGIIEQHMIETGFLPAAEGVAPQGVVAAGGPAGGLGMLCPKCSQPGVAKEGACLTCHHCGWSRCG